MEATSTKHANVYAMVTDLIIEKLEQGIVPWRKPWTSTGLPQNPVTARPYSGINLWLLASQGYAQNNYLTFRQIQDLGGSVIKGSKSLPVVFWKREEKEDEKTKEKHKVTVLRYYSVFNVEQCEGLPKALYRIQEHEPMSIKGCDAIFSGMHNPPKLIHKQPEAFYNVEFDTINLPFKKWFDTSEDYYETLFHELVHSTGHPQRLNRKEVTGQIVFGSDPYSREELVAEIGACYLKCHAGIEKPFDNSAAYIGHWLGVLKNDKRIIITASGQAQRAVDYILNKQIGNESNMTIAKAA